MLCKHVNARMSVFTHIDIHTCACVKMHLRTQLSLLPVSWSTLASTVSYHANLYSTLVALVAHSFFLCGGRVRFNIIFVMGKVVVSSVSVAFRSPSAHKQH